MTQVAHVAHRQPIDGAELSAAATDLSTLSSRGPTDDMLWRHRSGRWPLHPLPGNAARGNLAGFPREPFPNRVV